MKEIGGYIELDRYGGELLHGDALALNCGRNALAYLIRCRGIRRILLPDLICDSVTGVCEREGAEYGFYAIGPDLLPLYPPALREGEWLYLINYYSFLDNDRIASFVRANGRVIVDNAQSYFQPPLPGVDTLYTCRKFFGVPDGAFLYTDVRSAEPLPVDESFDRMRFLLGRFERGASEFYEEYKENNLRFASEPPKVMSRLTRNLLRGIDYDGVLARREENFRYLHAALGGENELRPPRTGSFAYPYLIKNGAALRKALQKEKIYVPALWPSVESSGGAYAVRLAADILPLPIDQRYGRKDMDRIIDAIRTEREKTV